MSIVLISIGSNLGNRVENNNNAICHMSEGLGKVIAQSPLYESKSWGKSSPNDYINSCILLETDLTPHELIEQIHNIENKMGRVRLEKYSDRIIDIDILLYDNLVIDSEDLIIPHPHMHDRLFVLVPANQIVPNLEHPLFHKSIQQLLLDCEDESNVYPFLHED